MKEKFDYVVEYIEDHMAACVFLLVAIRVLSYFMETTRRCFTVRRK